MIRTDLHPDAGEVLRRCEMPAEEIRWILAANDPAVVHMLLELHAERLREVLADRLDALNELEARLTSPVLRAS
jgi:ATP/maltotriose-dependent transcriptional regulator MalT